MDAQNEIRESNKENKAKIPVSVTGIDIGYRRPKPVCLRGEDFFSGEYDPLDIGIAVTHGDRKDRMLWRKYLRNGSIEESQFVECAFAQWRENLADGMLHLDHPLPGGGRLLEPSREPRGARGRSPRSMSPPPPRQKNLKKFLAQ